MRVGRGAAQFDVTLTLMRFCGALLVRLLPRFPPLGRPLREMPPEQLDGKHLPEWLVFLVGQFDELLLILWRFRIHLLERVLLTGQGAGTTGVTTGRRGSKAAWAWVCACGGVPPPRQYDN